MIEVHAEFPQREVIQANAVVDNEEKTVSEVIISAKPEITGVTASVDNNVGTPSVDVTETGTGTEFSFDLAFHNLKGEKGDTGEQGEQGEPGQDGQNGQDGADGQAATITVGSTTTGQAGTSASVVNSGTSSAAILDFTIPRGNTGATGVSVTGVNLISTQGLQKTYRMTFSNNTYYDYIVTDGASGSTAWGGISGTLSNQTDLQTELTGLQSQIDTLILSSDVFDIVGTYAELQAYDISTVPVNDIIKVLVDSTHSNAATYYRCVESGGVKSWSYIGTEGAYYTKSETDTLLNDKYDSSNPAGYTSNVGTVTSVNNTQPDANGNVTLAIPTVNDGTITITQGGVTKGSFTTNQSSNGTIEIDPTGGIVDQTYDPTSANAQSGVAILGLIETIYPIGGIYATTNYNNGVCPLASLFTSTWTLLSSTIITDVGSGSSASSSEVVSVRGNGKSLGLYDGENSVGIVGLSGTYTRVAIGSNAYNQTSGSAYVSGGTAKYNTCLGVKTNGEAGLTGSVTIPSITITPSKTSITVYLYQRTA